MKRIITTILIITVSCILFTLSAAADVNVDYNPDTQTLSVSGSCEDAAGKSVTLQILHPGKTEADLLAVPLTELKTVVYNIKETNCDSEGTYGFDSFKISGTSGYYGVRVCVNGQTPVYLEKGFLYVSPTFEAEMTETFNDEAVSAGELSDMLCGSSEVLHLFEFASYDEVQRTEIINLTSREAKSSKDITANVNIAVAVYKINNAADAGEVERITEDYGDYMASQCGVYNIYKNSDSDVKKEVAVIIAKNKEYKSSGEFLRLFGDSAIFETVYAMDNYLQLEEVLSDSQEWLNADFSSYFDCKNKKKAALEIIGKHYDDADELEAAVKKAVKNAQGTSSSGNKGNGGSGGGGSVIAVPQPQTPTSQVPGNTAPDNTPVFEDMKDVAWATEAVNALNKAGVINGISQTSFAPNSYVTREQFAKMVITAFCSADMQKRASFTDCPDSHWSSPYVAAAYEAGVVKGISDTEFGLGKNISRQDMAVILYRMANNEGIVLYGDEAVVFDDETAIAPYAKEAVDAMAKCGIISGMGDGMFAPEANATRAQAAKMIYELMMKGGVR